MKEIYTDSFTITRLWDVFADRKFAIPEIQREFVWDSKKACALLDSIYKKLPIGSVLVWETDGHNRALLRHSLHILPAYNDRNRHIWFLIDGQQRLSVLHQVKEGQKVENSNGKKIDFSKIYFVFAGDTPLNFVALRRHDPALHYTVKDVLAEDWQRRLRLLPAYKQRAVREWPGIPKTPFNMSNDSWLFINSDKLAERPDGGATYLPVYESKFIHQFNHRFATFSAMAEEGANELALPQLQNAGVSVASRYWLESQKLNDRYPGRWFLVYRMIARATDERTAIACIIPQRPSVNSVSIIEHLSALTAAVQAAEVNSFAHDYCTRQKVSGTNFNHWIWHQLPVLPLARITTLCQWASDSVTLQTWLLPRVLELTYTAWDLEAFARDCGWSGPPFRWDEARRFLLRCELDAAFFHLYGLNRDDTAYILDTFPIVKRKDEAKFGDYRTKLVILKIYDAMKSAMECSQPYQTLLNPVPADPLCCHPPKVATAKLELPTGARQPAPNPQVYLMQLTILLLHRNHGTLALDRMLDACALLSLPDMLAEHAAIEAEDVAKRWRSRFRDKIEPSLFLPMMREFIDRGVIRLKREGSGTLVVLADASTVPKNAEVEFDAELAMGVVNSMAVPELDALPEMVPDDALEEFCNVG